MFCKSHVNWSTACMQNVQIYFPTGSLSNSQSSFRNPECSSVPRHWHIYLGHLLLPTSHESMESLRVVSVKSDDERQVPFTGPYVLRVSIITTLCTGKFDEPSHGPTPLIWNRDKKFGAIFLNCHLTVSNNHRELMEAFRHLNYTWLSFDTFHEKHRTDNEMRWCRLASRSTRRPATVSSEIIYTEFLKSQSHWGISAHDSKLPIKDEQSWD